MAVFDGGANGFGERNWRIEMEAVDRGAAAGALFALHRRSMKKVRKATLPEIPCTKKIILGASADDGRARFAINEKHIVAFAPPAVLVLQHGHCYANKMPLTDGGKPKVIAFTGQILFVLDGGIAVRFPFFGPARIGLSLAELRVEVKRVWRKRFRVSAVIQIVVEGRSFLLAFVGNGDTRVFLEGHREKGIQRALICD